MLPWVYIGVAAMVTVSSLLYRTIGPRLSLQLFLPSVVAFNALSFFAMWLALWQSPQPWLRLALPIWLEVPFFLNAMVFYELADRVFDIRQVKRLYGRILSIGFLAGIVAGLTAAGVTGLIGAAHVVGLSFLSSLGLLAVTLWIQRTYSAELVSGDSREEGDAESEAHGRSARDLFKHPLALLIFLMVGMTILEFYILDNVFFGFAGKSFPGEAEFAVFYGTFSAAVNLVTMILLGFVTNRVLSRFGVGVGLMVMPGILLVVVVAANGVGSAGEYAGVMLGLVIAAKFLDDVLTPSFNEASSDVVYQALPLQYRGQSRSLADGVIYPVCAGIAGVLLLGLTRQAGADAKGLLALLLVVLIVCFVVARRIPAAYRESLRTALDRRSLHADPLLPTDAATVALLQAGLDDDSPSRVLYCLDLLIEHSPDSLDDLLVRLLDHRSDAVQRSALVRIADQRASSALPAVRRLAEEGSSPAVRGTAVLALAALLESEVVDEILPHLQAHAPEVQQSAMIGLLRSGGIEGVLAAGEHLLDMSRNPDAGQRARAATVIGAVGNSSFHRPLAALLGDEAIEVRRAALAAARLLGTARLLDPVARCLEVPGLRRPVGVALVAIGDAAIPRVLEIYAAGLADPALRELMLGILGRMRSESARNALRELLAAHSAPERASLAEALLRAGVRADKDPTAIHEAMEAAGRDAAWALSAAHRLRARDEASLLAESLFQFVDRQRDAILSFVGCLHPTNVVRRASALLEWPSPEMRAYAVELLDNTLVSKEKALLLPLIDGSNRDRQRRELQARFPVTHRTADEWCELIAIGDEVPAYRWLRCVALHELASTEDATQREVVRRLADDSDPEVRSSVRFLLAGWNEFEGQEGGVSMPSTVERVIFLKAIPIFSEIPEAALAELANRLRVQSFEPDTTIVSEGEIGTSLYVVVRGSVRVHRGEDEIARMDEGSVFGELAALDPHPRTASVTTLDEALLFSLDREALYELMAEHPIMLRGIIKILCERLRERHTNRDVATAPTTF